MYLSDTTYVLHVMDTYWFITYLAQHMSQIQTIKYYIQKQELFHSV